MTVPVEVISCILIVVLLWRSRRHNCFSFCSVWSFKSYGKQTVVICQICVKSKKDCDWLILAFSKPKKTYKFIAMAQGRLFWKTTNLPPGPRKCDSASRGLFVYIFVILQRLWWCYGECASEAVGITVSLSVQSGRLSHMKSKYWSFVKYAWNLKGLWLAYFSVLYQRTDARWNPYYSLRK